MEYVLLVLNFGCVRSIYRSVMIYLSNGDVSCVYYLGVLFPLQMVYDYRLLANDLFLSYTMFFGISRDNWIFVHKKKRIIEYDKQKRGLLLDISYNWCTSELIVNFRVWIWSNIFGYGTATNDTQICFLLRLLIVMH